MMWKFLCVNTDLHPASKILPMEINELCVSPDRICTPIYFWGSWGNANVHYLFDLIVTPFVSTTVIGGWLAVVCSLGLIGLM